METMVAYIMKDLAGSTDKQKASKIMETLKLIHTKYECFNILITYKLQWSICCDNVQLW